LTLFALFQNNVTISSFDLLKGISKMDKRKKRERSNIIKNLFVRELFREKKMNNRNDIQNDQIISFCYMKVH